MSRDSEYYADSTKELDFSEFKKIFENIGVVQEQIPAVKREFVERLGAQMEKVVRAKIGGTGKVASWQEAFIGKYSGYAAVRPKTGLFVNTKNYEFQPYKRATWRNRKILSGGHYSVRYVTNAIDLGHDIRDPSGIDPRYKPRIREAWVEGKHFYRDAQAFIESLTESTAKELAEAIARKIAEVLAA